MTAIFHRIFTCSVRSAADWIDLPAKDPQATLWLKQMIRDLFSVEDENVTVTTTLLQGVCNDCMAAEEADVN